MSGFNDIVSRADILINKYEKFDSKQKTTNVSKIREYDAAYRQLSDLYIDSDNIADELSVVAIPIPPEKAANLNAQLRRNKSLILEGLDTLWLLVNKGEKVTTQIIKKRREEIEELQRNALDLPDDVRGKSKSIDPRHREKIREADQGKRFSPPVHISNLNMSNVDGYMLETEEAQAFRQQWEKAKRQQDERLEVLREELENVQDIAKGILNEVEMQPFPMEALGERVEGVNNSLDNQNKRLKGVVAKMASPLKFCICSTMVLMILVLAGYVYFTFVDAGPALWGFGGDLGTPTPTPTPTPEPEQVSNANGGTPFINCAGLPADSVVFQNFCATPTPTPTPAEIEDMGGE